MEKKLKSQQRNNFSNSLTLKIHRKFSDAALFDRVRKSNVDLTMSWDVVMDNAKELQEQNNNEINDKESATAQKQDDDEAPNLENLQSSREAAVETPSPVPVLTPPHHYPLHECHHQAFFSYHQRTRIWTR